MAKKPTIKELQLQISKLKQSNGALRRHADERLAKLNAIKETNTELKKDYTNLREENEALQKQLKGASSTANEYAAKLIDNEKVVENYVESDKNFKSELRTLLSLPEKASMADILNAIVKLKLNKLANNAGLTIRELVGINPDSTTQQMVDRVKELVDAYNKAVKRGAEVFRILGIDKDSPDLIELVKQIMEDNFNLKATNESYKSYYNTLKKELNLKQGERIHNKIPQLQADLEAARKQEDINARALSEIENILEKTMGIFQLEEIEKVILELKKPKVKIDLKANSFTDAMIEAAKAMKDFQKAANLTGKTFRIPFQDLDDPTPYNFDKRYTAKEDIKAGSPVQFTDDGYVQYAGRGKRYDESKPDKNVTLDSIANVSIKLTFNQ